MIVLKSHVFSGHQDLIFGFSTKIGLNRRPPYNFNLSLSVGDDNEIVEENRAAFFNRLGILPERVAFQKQVHGCDVRAVSAPGYQGPSDAMICSVADVALAVSTGDCVPVFGFDPVEKIIIAIHSGWRSTVQNIVKLTLEKLFTEFPCRPENLLVYIGPSIQQRHFETDEDVSSRFDSRYVIPKGRKFHIDLVKRNYDMLMEFGLDPRNVQSSALCSYGNAALFHSYRREGLNSGRAYGAIMMKAGRK